MIGKGLREVGIAHVKREDHGITVDVDVGDGVKQRLGGGGRPHPPGGS